jgi:hypothetical protein
LRPTYHRSPFEQDPRSPALWGTINNILRNLTVGEFKWDSEQVDIILKQFSGERIGLQFDALGPWVDIGRSGVRGIETDFNLNREDGQTVLRLFCARQRDRYLDERADRAVIRTLHLLQT